ncbi:MAG TPA: ATP-binding cassette domain-containing protein, partial [Solirubrobacteraceae bacterium]|nr:ATP-binding cassette domain-containing protein [Solirubrobacteraceae bacterium]
MPAALEFQEVTKQYPGAQQPALDRLSLRIEPGETCMLVGPSGSGKTTAMRCVNRMVEVTDGDVLLDGRSILEEDPAQLRRHIGYVIQHVGLFPHRTVLQNIATVPHLLGWPKERIAARARELVELVGLDASLADRYPSQLSGGQRQRVGVARALAADPPLMLMDEPFGALDPITRERLQTEFVRLKERLGTTIVFVTHDVDEAIRLGDRVAILRDGALVQFATPAELLLHPADAFVEEFVGSDRALKRLALLRVADAELEPGEAGDGPPLELGASLRDALAALLA